MSNPTNINRPLSRRGFLGGAAAAGAVALLDSRGALTFAADAALPRPNSDIDGVKIGAITYSYRGGISTAEYTLECLLKDGLSETELMDGPIRSFAGITGGGRGRRGGNGGNAEQPSAQELAKRRASQLKKCEQIRKMYNDAGVNIHAHKFPFGRSDEEIDFNFEIAKALGCKAITTERNDAMAKRLAPFADKHGIWVAFHNHTTNYPQIGTVDPLFSMGDHIAFNLDIGHYVAGTHGKSPIPVIEKYHSKIFSLHLKDRTADGGTPPWGQGQVPIKQVLQLLKKEKWPIYADIELEYEIPKGSNPVAEVKKCVDYCREALA